MRKQSHDTFAGHALARVCARVPYCNDPPPAAWPSTPTSCFSGRCRPSTPTCRPACGSPQCPQPCLQEKRRRELRVANRAKKEHGQMLISNPTSHAAVLSKNTQPEYTHVTREDVNISRRAIIRMTPTRYHEGDGLMRRDGLAERLSLQRVPATNKGG